MFTQENPVKCYPSFWGEFKPFNLAEERLGQHEMVSFPKASSFVSRRNPAGVLRHIRDVLLILLRARHGFQTRRRLAPTGLRNEMFP